MKVFKDHTNKRYGRWTVIEYKGKDIRRQSLWLARCDCGTEKVVKVYTLVAGVQSCGCLISEVTAKRNWKHGYRHHPLYPCWNNMKHRCENPRSKEWKNYGGRGIKVCEKWQDFESFAADMGERPSPDHSLERKDNNADYCPENCKWGTREEQNNNKRTNHLLTHKGKTQSIMRWARETGVNHEKIRGRVRHGKEIFR